MSAVDDTYVAVAPVPDAPEIAPPPSYHCQLKDPVPPVTVDDNVAVCPLSIVTEEGSTEMEGVASTATSSASDAAVFGVGAALSVTT